MKTSDIANIRKIVRDEIENTLGNYKHEYIVYSVDANGTRGPGITIYAGSYEHAAKIYFVTNKVVSFKQTPELLKRGRTIQITGGSSIVDYSSQCWQKVK